MSAEVQAKITEIVNAHPVVLFMKGSRRFPQCGFSSRVVQILDKFLPRYETVNVLTDPGVRDGIKEFSQWPTIPQLYVRGKFVGGCDIVSEMFESGELKGVLGDLATAPAAATAGKGNAAAPSVTITDAAAAAFKEAAESDADHPRLVIPPNFQYELFLDEKKPDDVVVAAGGLSLLLDPDSATRANGMKIDFVGNAGGFKLENPNEPPRLRGLSPKELKEMLDRHEKFELLDTRPESERAIAKIEGSVMFDPATVEKLSHDAKIVLYCHSGGRSRRAGLQLVSMGFKHVFNLEGGVDAWARQIDPKVPTY
jgi:monothiol glutaredoxin